MARFTERRQERREEKTTQSEPVQVDSDVDVDVEHDSHGHTHTDTDRVVSVERSTEIDWTIDTGGESPHPTRVSSEGYTLPWQQPESS